MTDEEIVSLVQNGEGEKYGEIIDRYQKKLFWYLKGMTNQENETVEDMVEETLIKAYENLQEFDTKKKFSSWVYRIGHNKAIDFFRKARSSRIDDWQEENIPDESKLLEEIEIETETKEQVLKAVEGLEAKYKEVIWLYYFENKNYDEIADILKTTTSNVGVMLSRGKEKLKKKLETRS